MSEPLLVCEKCGSWAVGEFGMDLTPLCQTCWDEAERNYEAATRLHAAPQQPMSEESGER